MTSATERLHRAASDVVPPLGFRGSRGLYRMTVGSGVTGKLGLNTGNVGPGAITVQPMISVRHDTIEREIAARVGLSSSSGPTIVAHLTELDPDDDVDELLVTSDESAMAVMENIGERLVRSGIPWIREMATMEGLASGLERFTSMEPMFPRPLAYRAIGRVDLAIASIDQTLQEFAGLPNTGTVARFRAFAESLRPDLVKLQC
jgi:hypothetical protein